MTEKKGKTIKITKELALALITDASVELREFAAGSGEFSDFCEKASYEKVQINNNDKFLNPFEFYVDHCLAEVSRMTFVMDSVGTQFTGNKRKTVEIEEFELELLLHYAGYYVGLNDLSKLAKQVRGAFGKDSTSLSFIEEIMEASTELAL